MARETKTAEGPVGPEAARETISGAEGGPVVAARRRLTKWTGKALSVGLPSQPVPGHGPEGEAIVAMLDGVDPLLQSMARETGWHPAEPGTGEILNEEDYEVADGRLVRGDNVVMIRDAELDRQQRALEREEIQRIKSRLAAGEPMSVDERVLQPGRMHSVIEGPLGAAP